MEAITLSGIAYFKFSQIVMIQGKLFVITRKVEGNQHSRRVPLLAIIYHARRIGIIISINLIENSRVNRR